MTRAGRCSGAGSRASARAAAAGSCAGAWPRARARAAGRRARAARAVPARARPRRRAETPSGATSTCPAAFARCRTRSSRVDSASTSTRCERRAAERHQHAHAEPAQAEVRVRDELVVEVVDRGDTRTKRPAKGAVEARLCRTSTPAAARDRGSWRCSPSTQPAGCGRPPARPVARDHPMARPRQRRLAVDEGDQLQRPGRRASAGISSRAYISMPPVSPGTRKTRLSRDPHPPRGERRALVDLQVPAGGRLP